MLFFVMLVYLKMIFYDFRYGRYKIDSDFFSILFSKKKILMHQKINYLENKISICNLVM